MSGYGKIARERNERKNKLFMLLQAGGPMTSVELANHPTINQDARAVDACLRGLHKDKRVTKEGKKWQVLHADNKEAAKMFFVMNLKTRSFQLEIGGVRLPLIVES